MASGVFAQDQLSQEDMQAMQQMMQQMQMQMEQVTPGDYIDEALGYSLNIPNGFTGMKVDRALTVVKGGLEAMMVDDPSRMPLSIGVITAPREEDTPASVEEADFEKLAEAQVASINSQGGNAQVLRSEKTTLNGKDCLFFITAMSMEGIQVETCNYMFIENNQVYYLVFTYPTGTYDTNKDEISAIAGTFQIQ